MLMIYGATGFTGHLIVAEAIRRGLKPMLAGRSTAVEVFAKNQGLHARRFDLTEAGSALEGVKVLLNCAGPFGLTAMPLASAAVGAGAHYLDLAGEYPEHRALQSLSASASKAGTLLVPGVGFGVAPTDVAAALACQDLDGVTDLVLGYDTSGTPSKGTLSTVLPMLHQHGIQRRDGRDVAARGGEDTLWRTRNGSRIRLVTNPWRADLVSAALSTGVPNIKTYSSFPVAARLLMRIGGSPLGPILRNAALSNAPDGPSPEAQAQGRTTIWATATGSNGRQDVTIEGPDAYDFTAFTAIECAVRALNATTAGLNSPTMAFGVDILSRLSGVTIQTTRSSK